MLLTIRSVLCPTDFSDRSRYAFGVACALARDYGARLTVLHVIEPAVVTGELGLAMVLPEQDVEWARGQLESFRPPPGAAPPDVAYRCERGDAAGTILRVADATGCDLIVMGTHGRTGLDRLLAGSVAESVQRRAACPVLCVRVPVPATVPADEVVGAAAAH